MVIRDYDRSYADKQLARSRSRWRRLVKGFYLDRILSEVRGRTIDFGCGAGQLLERLPTGSVGVEVNPYLVESLKARGLTVLHYRPNEDGLRFEQFTPGRFETFVMAHVLEHFEDAANGLRQILDSCRRLAIARVVVIVPGQRGFEFDATHRTFVTCRYLSDNGLVEYNGFRIANLRYFPLNYEFIGRVFAFHELQVVYERA